MVEAPELFSNVNAILEEFAQLEEARKFHLALCAPVMFADPLAACK